MGYGVHGDESSASNSALIVAYYLAASESNEVKQLPDLAEDQIREMEALPESQMNELLAAWDQTTV